MTLPRNITATLFLLCCGFLVCAQSNRPQPVNDGPKSGSISGRVLSESGQPIPNAIIFVNAATSLPNSRRAATDSKGAFQIKELEVALYTVSASAPGYIQPSRDPTSVQPTYFKIGDEITFHLIKGGVITGVVTTPVGEPIVRVNVRAVMIRETNGQVPNVGNMISLERFTDDRGVYRLYGLRPGTYFVSAGGRGSFPGFLNPYETDAPTYAPSSVRETASEVNVVGGEETVGVDIRYRGEAGRRVSGTVVSAALQNTSSTSVNLRRVRNGITESVYNHFMGQRSGFEFYGIADGEYVVEAQASIAPNEVARSEPKKIVVKGADVSGIVLSTRALANIAGRIVLDPSSLPECKDKRRPVFGETMVTSTRIQEGKSSDPPIFMRMQSLTDKDGAFFIRHLVPGRYSLGAKVSAKYWYLRRISLPSPAGAKSATAIIDVARNGISLKSGDRLTKLTVTFAEGAASLRGRVKRESVGEDPSRFIVFLVPAEREAGDNALRFFAAPVEADGQFTFSNLSPGSYWTIIRRMLASDGLNLDTLRNVDQPESRAKLRREAEAGKMVVNLKPCQNVVDYELAAGSHSGSH